MSQAVLLAPKVETAPAPRRSRGSGTRGSETRKRTEQIKLRVLPDERSRIEQAAREVGITGPGFAQRYMRYLLGFDADAIV